jgi:cytochrome c biogenesis protein
VIRGLGIDDTFHTWWFRLLLVVFAAQILLCTIGRFRTAWVQLLRPGAFEPEGGQERVFVPAAVEEVVLRAGRLGYRRSALSPSVDPSGEGVAGPHSAVGSPGSLVTLARGRLQPLGFIVLHVSLLVVLGGMTLNLSRGFSEALYLPEGKRVLQQNTNRLVELVDLKPQYEKVRDAGDETDYELAGMQATIAVYDGGRRVREGVLELGSTLRFDRGDVVLRPSPPGSQLVFRITAPQGTSVVERLSSGAPTVPLSGGEGLHLRVLDFARDAEPATEGWVRRSPVMRHPLAAVAVVRESSDGDSEEVGRADLQPGESLAVNGYTIDFLEAVYMPVAVVSSRDGETMVLGGIAANLLGVLLSLGFSFRQLRLYPVDGGVQVVGFARRRNQPLAEELARLVGEEGAAEQIGEAPGGAEGSGT